jgi:carboxymethylenebutenolidase
MNDQPVAGLEALGAAPIGRRSVVRRMAALSAAPAIAGSGLLGFAGPAFAATDDSRLNMRDVRYALRGGKTLTGYFASLRGKANLGVVVVMPDQVGVDAKAQETARRYAHAGYLAIAPDLGATFKGGSRDAMVAEMMNTVPELKRLSHSNSKAAKISVVAA